MCSSTNEEIRPSASGSGPSSSGCWPAARIASAMVIPSASRSASARSGLRTPVITRDPAHETPNRAPSSSTKFTTPIGRCGRKPSDLSRSIASNPLTTPSGPSNAPPSGTLSRWEPVTIPPDEVRPEPVEGSPTDRSGLPHQAHWLPIRSSARSRPRLAHSPLNHSRILRSASDHAKRR